MNNVSGVSIAFEMKIKMMVILFMVAFLWALLIYRLYILQIKESVDLTAKAEKQQEGILKVYPIRGSVFDSKGNILAVSIKAKSLFCVPGKVDNIWSSANVLSQICDIPKNNLIKKMTKESKFAWLKRKLTDEEASKIENSKLSGIYLIDESKRFYPKGSMLSHVLGFVNIDNEGIEGLELFFNESLRGTLGLANIVTDAKGREIFAERAMIEDAKNGYDIVLTIDEVIQDIVEKEIDVAYEKYSPKGISIIVMDIKTGDILGMASRPTYDLNNYQDTSADSRKNRAIVDTYEPGSLFKVITGAVALNENLTYLDEVIFCEHGVYRTGGQTLHDSHEYGNLTFAEVVAKSSNIGFAKIAERIDEKVFYKYIKDFGFGNLVGIPLYGESKGKVWHYKHWSGYSKTAMAMGHEIMVTPLQMAAAISTIANRGKYVRPKLVKSLVSSNGEISKDFDDKDKEGREIIRPQVVFKLNEALKMVTSEGGTAIKAGIEGYPVAGKTGTAQKLIEGRYSHSKYISSFYGYLPADNPRISITVMIDEPSGRTYGGDAAAPVFSRIGEKAILYFDPPAFDKSLLETKEGSVEEKDAA